MPIFDKTEFFRLKYIPFSFRIYHDEGMILGPAWNEFANLDCLRKHELNITVSKKKN